MTMSFKLLTKEDFRNGDKKIFERLFGGSAKGDKNGTGVSVVEGANKTTFTFTNAAVSTTDVPGTCGYGSLKIYDFPEGAIIVGGSVANLTIAAAAGITATSAVVSSVGTAPAAADATLTATEADIIPSTTSTLTGSAGAFSAVYLTSAGFDGTATAKDAYLNFAMPDAGSTANSTITVNGTLTIDWRFIADK